LQKVIDAHVHLDDRISGGAINAAKILDNDLKEIGIEKAIVLHLDFQRWSVKEFSDAILPFKRLVGFVNINPDHDDAIEQLDKAVNLYSFKGLKLHPRLLEHKIDNENSIKLVQHAGNIGIPVIICGFPDGDWLMQGGSVLSYANLAKSCPHTKIVVAHMGGHHVIDMMMLAKRLPNIYLDTSYSLLYYRGSSEVQNLMYAMKSMRFERIFYGSDYPDRPISDTLNKSKDVMIEFGLDDKALERILYTNAKEFFNW
jgi:predicted TIM-barrel fold metal-dependent hydrolase